MSPDVLRVLTDFGDTAVVIPLATLLVLLTWKLESRQAAWFLARATASCLVMMAMLKFVLLSCSHATTLPASSPSGHAALTLFFYGSLATIVYVRVGALLKIVTVAVALLLIGTVAVSRVTLGAHTPLEVVTGVLVGLLSLLWFVKSYADLPHPKLQLPMVTLVLVPVLLLTLGRQLPTERTLRNLVPNFQVSVCPI